MNGFFFFSKAFLVFMSFAQEGLRPGLRGGLIFKP